MIEVKYYDCLPGKASSSSHSQQIQSKRTILTINIPFKDFARLRDEVLSQLRD